MEYEWDPHKPFVNLKKHGVHFADAIFIFSDDYALTITDDDTFEERFIVIGKDGFGRLLVVVFTFRGRKIRIISARKATKTEKDQYENCR